MLSNLNELTDRVLWQSRTGEPRILTWLRVFARYPYAVIRDAVEGQLTMRAMSLVYTTLLSIVPLIAFCFSLFAAFDMQDQIEPFVRSFLQPLGSEQADKWTGELQTFVRNQRNFALSSVSLLVLLYTAISMVQKVEESLNYVWQVQRTRSFARRFSEYFSILLIAPVLMLSSTALKVAVTSNTLVQKLTEYDVVDNTLLFATNMLPWFMVTAVFTFIFALVPNTRVKLVAAVIGGLCAGILWVATGALFTNFVVGSANYKAVYATFATTIVALIWLYANWLILLVGGKVSFYVQHPEMLRYGHRQVVLGIAQQEQAALQAMQLVGEAFHRGDKPWVTGDLADRLGVPGRALAPVLSLLEQSGLLVAADRDRVVPGRSLDSMTVHDVLEAVRSQPPNAALGRPPKELPAPLRESVEQIDAARAQSAANVTLEQLVIQNDSAPEKDAG